MKKVVMMLAVMLMAMSASAKRSNPDVVGHVMDENGEPMAFTNVVLLSEGDSAFVMGAVTDDEGAFTLKTSATTGILKISSVGYETQYVALTTGDMNAEPMTVRMSADSQTLDEVVIKGTLPKTRVSGDAMRTTVAGSVLEKSGTAADVLNKIPSVSAERDGGVSVFGRGSAEVYINGRRVQDLKELSRLTSDQIQSVDVVQNPGARYAASTKAVVRIQLKKAKGEGFGFQDYLSNTYQYGTTTTNAFEANYRVGGLDITGELWMGRYGHSKSLQENNLTYYNGSDMIVGKTRQDAQGVWKGWSPQLQVNYMVNENHSFGAFYKYDRHPEESRDGEFVTDTYQNGSFIERLESNINQGGSFTKHIFNAYYLGKVGSLGIDFNIDGLFDDTDDPNRTDEVARDVLTGETSHNFVSNDTKSSDRFIASKLIFTLPLWNGNLSWGGEYSHNSRHDAYSYTCDQVLPVQATDTDIRENVASAFAEYGHQFGRLYAQLGMRYEYLNNQYYSFGKKQEDMSRKYGDWFPTAVLSMPVGDVQLALSYRRDIQRPSYSNLSSSTIYLNKYTYQSGNPYLTPQYSHSIQFNAAYKAFNLSMNFSRTRDEFTMITERMPGCDDPLVSLVRVANGSKGYNQFVINPSYRPVFGCWHPMWSVGAVFQNYRTLCAEGNVITLNRPFGQMAWNNDIELPHGYRINAFAQLNTRGDYGNYRLTKIGFNSRLGVQKDFNLKRLGTLTVDARVMDPFNLNEQSSTIYSIRELTSYNPARRTFQLDLTWKFNEARSKYRGSGAGEKQKARM